MALAYIAASCLGMTVGWLIWTFVQRAKTLSVKAITSLSSLAAGGLVIITAIPRTSASNDAILAYPIGVFVAVLVLGVYFSEYPDSRTDR